MSKRVCSIILGIVLAGVAVIPAFVLAANNAEQYASTRHASTITVKDQAGETDITTITFLPGAPGAIVSNPTNSASQEQVFGTAGVARPVVTLDSGPFTFIVYGDTREQAPLFTQLERHKLVADRIAEEPGVSFVLHTGDLVCDGDDLDEWGRFFEAARQMLDGIPIYPIPGNHESDSTNYYEIFGVPSWYSFECANAYFAMLNSNDGADSDTQAAWLATDMANDADWKFAACHHPPYTSAPNHWGGYPDLREQLGADIHG